MVRWGDRRDVWWGSTDEDWQNAPVSRQPDSFEGLLILGLILAVVALAILLIVLL